VSVDESDPEPLAPEPHPDAAGATPSWNAVMAFCRVLVPAGFVGTALIGAFVTPPIGMLLVAPLTGAGVGLLAALVNPAFPAETWARRGALISGATGAAFVPFVNGVALLGAVGGVLAVVLLVLGSCRAANWMIDVIEDSPARMSSRDERWTRMVMPSLPTATLLQEWRATQAVVGSRPVAERTRAVQLRGILLEELARRDPAAVERWLRSGDWSSGPQIRSDRDVAG
jgi:hypothetical protein